MIYQQRREAMQGGNLKPVVMDMIEDLVDALLAECTDAKTYAEDWDLESLNNEDSGSSEATPIPRGVHGRGDSGGNCGRIS